MARREAIRKLKRAGYPADRDSVRTLGVLISVTEDQNARLPHEHIVCGHTTGLEIAFAKAFFDALPRAARHHGLGFTDRYRYAIARKASTRADRFHGYLPSSPSLAKDSNGASSSWKHHGRRVFPRRALALSSVGSEHDRDEALSLRVGSASRLLRSAAGSRAVPRGVERRMGPFTPPRMPLAAAPFSASCGGGRPGRDGLRRTAGGDRFSWQRGRCSGSAGLAPLAQPALTETTLGPGRRGASGLAEDTPGDRVPRQRIGQSR